ncbi:TRAP transporter small permease [Martelella radicis]|uniref:TRAP transporter small permease protein n=1 Tax=Martelella radicis TaxID=1397476 RepID=A0A7W6KMC2_9HYPH|nr:TRAP transporter small permease [Martelella radicis]MBB4122483.1 TRAP-type C4-dicarboxylate transport system permease small subunit [Martelella radicis]
MNRAVESHGKPGARQYARLSLAVVCALLLVTIMMITVVDVIGRYVLNAPLMGATELTELLLCAVIFLGLPAVCLDDAHIRVDILLSRVPPALEPLRKIAVSLVSAIVLGLIAWRLWGHAGNLAGYAQSTNTLKIPVAPLAYLTSVAVAVSAVITVVNGITGGDDKTGEAGL